MYGSCCAAPSSPPSGLQLALPPLPHERGILWCFVIGASLMVTLSRCLFFLHFSPLPSPPSTHLSIYLSICPSVSTTYFFLYSASLRLCLHLFVLMYLNNSHHSPHTFLLLLSLYLRRSLPPPPTLSLTLSLSMVQWSPLWSTCGITWRTEILSHTPQRGVSFSAHLPIKFGSAHVTSQHNIGKEPYLTLYRIIKFVPCEHNSSMH